MVAGLTEMPGKDLTLSKVPRTFLRHKVLKNIFDWATQLQRGQKFNSWPPQIEESSIKNQLRKHMYTQIKHLKFQLV